MTIMLWQNIYTRRIRCAMELGERTTGAERTVLIQNELYVQMCKTTNR